MAAMADHDRALTTTLASAAPPLPERVVLPDVVPGIEDLFRFARDAELRVTSLRMVIDERLVNAAGEARLRHELWLRHPGQARVTVRRSDATLSRDYEIWLLDGDRVTTFSPDRNVASRRPVGRPVAGVDRADLPPSSRQRPALTPLPGGSLLDAFVHPHGLFRNVLVTGPLAIVGTRQVGEREAVVVRSDHPRSAKVLVDRPDRSLEVGIDRASGFLLLLIERIGEAVTREAEVRELVIDPVVPATAFELRMPADVRMLY
jgi:hypothetical protein